MSTFLVRDRRHVSMDIVSMNARSFAKSFADDTARLAVTLDSCVFHSEGVVELEPDGSDRFELFSAALPVSDAPLNVTASFLVRARCRNVTLFPGRMDLSTAFDALRRLRQTPLTPAWAARFTPLLLEPQHRACLAGSPPDLFEVVDRMTAMGRAEGGGAFIYLGLLAGCTTLAAAEFRRKHQNLATDETRCMLQMSLRVRRQRAP